MFKNYFPKKSKYKNRKVIVDGIKFDSQKEAARYSTLKLLQEKGIISDLKLQVKFDLLPGVSKLFRKRIYIADFTYMKNGEFVAEDVKGIKTDMYKIKKHLMFYIHKILIKEV